MSSSIIDKVGGENLVPAQSKETTRAFLSEEEHGPVGDKKVILKKKDQRGAPIGKEEAGFSDEGERNSLRRQEGRGEKGFSKKGW